MNDQNIIPLDNHPQHGALAAVEQSRAVQEVQASLIIAKRFPRDEEAARQKILKDCCRPILADVAIYEYKRGGTAVTGPSIRLAEAMKRSWGNIESGWRELERKHGESTLQAYAWDKETNVREERTFNVRQVRVTAIYEGGKNTGRKSIKPLDDERDIYENNANQAARRVRACILALMPPDIIEEAVNQCEATLAAKEEVTAESIVALVKAFEAFKITRDMLAEYTGRNLTPEAISAAMMVKLRTVYKSIKDGVGTVEDFFVIMPEAKPAEAQQAAEQEGKSSIEAFKEKNKEPEKQEEIFPGDIPLKK